MDPILIENRFFSGVFEKFNPNQSDFDRFFLTGYRGLHSDDNDIRVDEKVIQHWSFHYQIITMYTVIMISFTIE